MIPAHTVPRKTVGLPASEAKNVGHSDSARKAPLHRRTCATPSSAVQVCPPSDDTNDLPLSPDRPKRPVPGSKTSVWCPMTSGAAPILVQARPSLDQARLLPQATRKRPAPKAMLSVMLQRTALMASTAMPRSVQVTPSVEVT